MIYRLKNNDKLYLSKESVKESIISDIFTAISICSACAFSKWIFGDNCVVCCLLIQLVLILWLKSGERVVTTDEMIKMIKELEK